MNSLTSIQNSKLSSTTRRLITGITASLISLGTSLQSLPAWADGMPPLLSQANIAEPLATQTARISQKQAQLSQIRAENYDLTQHPVTDANEKHWRNILWTTAIVEPQQPFVAQSLSTIISYARNPGISASQHRTIEMAFQVGTQLYLNHPNIYGAVGQQLVETVSTSPNPRFVALSLSALANSSLTPAQIQNLSNLARQRFPQWSQNVALRTTVMDVNEKIAPSPTPPLRDLLNWTIAPGQLQMYVVCGRDRNALCTAMLKDGQGQFVREGGQLWSTPLLLRSLHKLGWNFTRGETPQGIYRIEGSIPQPDTEFFRAFGRFSLVNLFVPFEPGAKTFLPGKAGMFSGSLESYQSMLPPTWRSYPPIQQTFWAGYLGRGAFRIHGSGEDPNFFSKLPQDAAAVAWNPTIGCLSALEIYDGAGQLQRADMPRILKVLREAGGPKFTGYLIVVETAERVQNVSALAPEAGLQ
jgi:hypothetical protein